MSGKILLNKNQKQLLTNRYLTYQMLCQIDIPYYQNLAKSVEKDIKKINTTTTENSIKNGKNYITLKDTFEVLKLYNRYKNILTKTEEYSEEDLRKEIQNLPWDTLMFAFSSYYEKKPYLSELIQVVQAFIWKIGAKLFSPIFQYGAEFLEHSLQEKPEDLYITEGKIIEEIKKDENFTKKIDKILKEYGNGSEFDTQENESINYKNLDLFLALNNTEINVKGNRENNKWKLDITITDIYDFTDLKEFNEYIDDNIIKGFIGSFLNNSAMLSTAFNVINQYNITIKFSDEREI